MKLIFNFDAFLSNVAVCTESGQCFTYEEIRDLARVATESINCDDLVAIECNNSIYSIVSYVGIVRRGVPAILVDQALNESKKEALYRHYQVSVVISDGSVRRIARKGPIAHLNLALLLSTSGSTGSPKLVRLTCDNLEANARQISKYLALDSGNRAITTLPQQYSFGLSIINSHFIVGGSIALTDRSIAERQFWNFFNASCPDSLSGVPATFEMLRRIRIDRMKLPSLKAMTQAGGRLSADSIKFFAELGKRNNFKFWVMYGQTEATARIAYLPYDEALNRAESIGIPIPEGRIELNDAQGAPIEKAGEVGELVYLGPNVMMGYASEVSDLALGDVQNGRLNTGDLAERDEDGFYYIRGRIKRFIKLFGNRVNLDEVEKELQGNGLNVYITGRDDLLLIAGTNTIQLESAAQHFSTKFHFHSSAIKTMALEEVPRNDAGKVQYAEILKQFDSTEGLL